MLKRIPLLSAIFLAVALSFAVPAKARAETLSFIRDAEIERTIRVFSSRVFEAAGLNPNAVEIYLVKDNRINAFVAGGQKLFLHTGLLMRAEHAGQVVGVIAHESGHIAGGHLARIQEQLANSTAQSIVAMVLGGVAAVTTGRGDVGGAIAMGGSQIGQRSLLQYSRTQEYAADQAAVRFLEDAGISARGLAEFLTILSDQELSSTSGQSPYVRTHPLSRDRVEAIMSLVNRSPTAGAKLPAEYEIMHERMRAKLRAFLEPMNVVLRYYPSAEKGRIARYAHAIAHYRRADLDHALPLIDGLIAEVPDDPFFHELKGQMLFENARVAEALPQYETAVRLHPDSALLRTDLARVQIESGDPALLEPAIQNLRMAATSDSDRASVWRLLAIAYGRDGQMGLSALALAEENLLLGKRREARFQAGKAEKMLPVGSPGWIKAQDILGATEKDKDKDRDN